MKVFLLIAIAVAATAQPAVRVGVAVSYPAEMGKTARTAFERETTEAMAEAGVDLVWGTQAGEAFERVVVVRFTDHCQEPEAGLALGLTHISDGRVLPFVEMECGRVRRMVGDQAGMLGRALGRVAAHEMHHVLTASSTHDVEGLTKAVFTRSDLGGRELRFAPAAVARMRAALEQRGGGDQRAGAEE